MKINKKIIGRVDKVDFPELSLYNIEVKIDTGAYTSSIHCHNISVFRKKGKPHVRFNLLDPTHPEYDEKEFILPVYKRKRVKSSSGDATIRTFIQTKILLFGELMDIELSLADRSDMKYPVLLGRKLLKRRYVVDVSKRNLSFKKKTIQSSKSSGLE